MATQPELYERFRALHEQKCGFIMPNPWDGTSALLLKQAGFQALGTSSAAIASAMGRLDGRHAVTREEHLTNARLVGGLTGLPVNGDFEDGYGASPRDVAATVEVGADDLHAGGRTADHACVNLDGLGWQSAPPNNSIEAVNNADSIA
jgi:2-methylisocitrate lyase-like PEP mutase family enzyme